MVVKVKILCRMSVMVSNNFSCNTVLFFSQFRCPHFHPTPPPPAFLPVTDKKRFQQAWTNKIVVHLNRGSILLSFLLTCFCIYFTCYTKVKTPILASYPNNCRSLTLYLGIFAPCWAAHRLLITNIMFILYSFKCIIYHFISILIIFIFDICIE